MKKEPAAEGNIPGSVLWLTWATLLLTIVIYFLILQVHAPEIADRQSTPDKPTVRKVALLACLNFAMAFGIWHAFALRFARDRNNRRRAWIFPTCLISWLLAEAVAIYGLVLGIMGVSAYDYGGFLLAGFSALIYLIPNFVPFESGR